MSMLWKKPKSGRFSRFMSEFQQSSKRGGSLFVETGFPTSLIDLFVKNRDHLKKSSTKRLKRNSQTAPTAFYAIKPDVVTKEHVYVPSKVEKRVSVAVESNKRANEKNVCVCVLMVLQIFIVSLLVLSTKKNLTLGITLSALALFFTEIVAARLLKRFKNAEKIAVFHQKTFDDLHNKKVVSCLEEKTELVAADLNKALRIRDLLLKDEKSKSKSSKLKSKIVNKLRSYKINKKTIKVKEETLSEVSSLVSLEDTAERIEDQEVLNPLLVVEESKGDQTNGIIVMMVIVLVGLLSGKIFAIVLTLSCVLLKFGVAKKYSLGI